MTQEELQLGAIIKIFDIEGDDGGYEMLYEFHGEDGDNVRNSHLVLGAIHNAVQNGKIEELLEDLLETIQSTFGDDVKNESLNELVDAFNDKGDAE